MKLESEMYSQTTWHDYHMLDKARRSKGILFQGKTFHDSDTTFCRKQNGSDLDFEIVT